MTEDRMVSEHREDACAVSDRGRWLAAGSRWPIGIVLAVALVPRLAYLWEIKQWPFFTFPILDSRVQWKWAEILLNSYGIGNTEVLGKAPLYSYFLALNQWLLPGRDAALFSAHLFQLLLGAATCGLTYLIGRRIFGAGVGFVAGLLLALYSPGVFRDGQLLDTSLATFLATVLLLLVLRAFDRPDNLRNWLAAGLILGALGLTRPNLLLLSVVTAGLMIGWLRRELWTTKLARAIALFAVGVFFPILLITGRNFLLAREFVPISSTGGINLYTGNNADADGYSPIRSGIAWERTWYEAIEVGARNSRDVDAYWQEKALEFWRQSPADALKLLGKKAYLYWNAYEIPNNVSYDWGREHSAMLRFVPLTFALVGPMALLGMAFGGWRGRPAWLATAFVLTQMTAVALFFVSGRYRMPAVPLLCIFAAYGPFCMGRMVASRRIARLVVSCLALALAAWLVNSDALGARQSQAANRDWFYLGQSHMLRQDFENAAKAMQRAVEQDPTDADAYWLLGQSKMHIGQMESAERHLREAIRLAPDFTRAAVTLSDLHIQQELPLGEVRRILREAVEQQPRNLEGWVMLVRLDLEMADLDQAGRDLASASELLGELSMSDTRTASSARLLRMMAAQAAAAGVRLPESRPSNSSQRSLED